MNKAPEGAALVVRETTFSNLLIQNCRFKNNTGEQGAGMYRNFFTILGLSLFKTYGPGLAQIIDCDFLQNVAETSSGVLCYETTQHIVIIRGLVAENIASQGSGVVFFRIAAPASITGTRFVNNWAKELGGGLIAV